MNTDIGEFEYRHEVNQENRETVLRLMQDLVISAVSDGAEEAKQCSIFAGLEANRSDAERWRR